jgi:hypothetical protein
VGLLVGLNKHGFNCFDEIRRDTDMMAAFQVGRLGRGWVLGIWFGQIS